MGYAEEPVPDPQKFLKKHTNDIKANAAQTSWFDEENSFSISFDSIIFLARDSSKQREETSRKAPVPSLRDAPKMGARTEKNFIQSNALDAVMTVPKKPERNMVDDRFGDKFPIDQSGLTPKYVLKKVKEKIIFNRK